MDYSGEVMTLLGGVPSKTGGVLGATRVWTGLFWTDLGRINFGSNWRELLHNFRF